MCKNENMKLGWEGEGMKLSFLLMILFGSCSDDFPFSLLPFRHPVLQL